MADDSQAIGEETLINQEARHQWSTKTHLLMLRGGCCVLCAVCCVLCAVCRVSCVVRVACRVSRVACRVSRVACRVSRVACRVSRVACFAAEAWWRGSTCRVADIVAETLGNIKRTTNLGQMHRGQTHKIMSDAEIWVQRACRMWERL